MHLCALNEETYFSWCMVVRLINTATSLSLVWPYSMFCFADQWLSSPPNFCLRVMYQRVCLTNDDFGKKMAFENYKISINLVFHKKQICGLLLHILSRIFLWQRGQILSLIDMSYEIKQTFYLWLSPKILGEAVQNHNKS